jgi:gliding motility-associated-like protein
VAQPANTSTYTVFVTDVNQCTAVDSVIVTVNPLPLLEAGNDTSFCQGGSVHLNATGFGTFLWTPPTGLNTVDVPNPIASPAATTSYSVTLTDANNCSSSDALTVTVLGLPNATAGADQYLCPGFGVQLSGSGGGSANWSPNATLDNASILNPVASPVITTTYTLVITDGNGCTGSDIVVVNVSTDPPVDAGADQSVCQGEQVTLGGNPTNIPGTSVLWSPSTDLSDVTASNPVCAPQATTLYTVTVTSDTCTSQDVVLVTLQGIAQAAFTMRLEPGCDQLRAFFTDQSSGAAQWAWDFGDGSTSTEQNPQHLFTYGQPITVTLVVTDNLGCTGSITQTFPTGSFDDLVDYEIPNVFTPNGDGKNDVFTLNSNGFLGPCVNLQVFNRWGQKMFESFGNDITWTGRNMAGEECTTGTYFYTLTLKDMSFNGNVYLNR